MKEKPYPLRQVLAVMKPCHLDFKNPEHVRKFNLFMEDGSDYIEELKIDGNHYLMIDMRFFSTRISVKTGLPVEKTSNVPHIVKELFKLNMPQLVLDGELNYPGLKSQDVTAITGSLPELAIEKQEEQGFLRYTVFDILRVPGGRWLLNSPWYERRKLLEALFREYLADSLYIHLNPTRRRNKKKYLDDILAQGGEGVVLKDIFRGYEKGHPMWNWIKVKAETTDDVVIIGFDPPTRIYTGKDLENWLYWENGVPVTKYHYNNWIGAIIIGKYDQQGNLVRVGTCSGFEEDLRRGFSENQNHYVNRVIKIKAMEKTPDGAYRHPSFAGFHSDKNPSECKLEEAS